MLSLSFLLRMHIFPKAQVAANKNAHNFWRHLHAQFFMLFHMVGSILFRALKTLDWKFAIGYWNISTNEKAVCQANTLNKMDQAKWKKIKLCPKMVSEVVCIFVWGHAGFWEDVNGHKELRKWIKQNWLLFLLFAL